MLYPLLFKTITKPKVWGREVWLLSGYGDEQSVVANGFLKGNSLGEVLEVYMDELVGGKVYDRYGMLFPPSLSLSVLLMPFTTLILFPRTLRKL